MYLEHTFQEFRPSQFEFQRRRVAKTKEKRAFVLEEQRRQEERDKKKSVQNSATENKRRRKMEVWGSLTLIVKKV